MCKSSETVDEVTGVSGLFGFKKDRPTDAMMDALVAPPAELAPWARAAAATKLDKLAPELAVESTRVTFPERRDQRMLARLRIVLPAGVGLAVAGDEKSPESRLTVAGRLEVAGAPFEEFRNRFVLAPPAATTPVVLVAERLLRPGGPLRRAARAARRGLRADRLDLATASRSRSRPCPSPRRFPREPRWFWARRPGSREWAGATPWC